MLILSRGRVAVVPTVLTTDTVYGFYSYFEPDVVYTVLDVNPVTNPSIKNTVICFELRPRQQQSLAGDLPPGLQRFRPDFGDDQRSQPSDLGSPQTPANGTVFAKMVVGVSFGIATFEMTDVRTRGGGLAPAYQTIPQADNFWDSGLPRWAALPGRRSFGG